MGMVNCLMTSEISLSLQRSVKTQVQWVVVGNGNAVFVFPFRMYGGLADKNENRNESVA